MKGIPTSSPSAIIPEGAISSRLDKSFPSPTAKFLGVFLPVLLDIALNVTSPPRSAYCPGFTFTEAYSVPSIVYNLPASNAPLSTSRGCSTINVIFCESYISASSSLPPWSFVLYKRYHVSFAKSEGSDVTIFVLSPLSFTKPTISISSIACAIPISITSLTDFPLTASTPVTEIFEPYVKVSLPSALFWIVILPVDVLTWLLAAPPIVQLIFADVFTVSLYWSRTS